MAAPSVPVSAHGATFHLTLHRRGKVEVVYDSQNQCKAIGHKKFEYIVTITAPATALDHAGYLLEHEVVHQLVKTACRASSSCERMCASIASAILSVKVPIQKLNVKLLPVVQKPDVVLAYMELNWTRPFDLTIKEPPAQTAHPAHVHPEFQKELDKLFLRGAGLRSQLSLDEGE